MGAAAPILLASFRLLSLATYALRKEEKIYENISMGSTMDQYIGRHTDFDNTQNGVVVAELDLALTNFLYNLYISSVGYVTTLGRRRSWPGISTGAGGCRVEVVFARVVQRSMGWEDDGKQTEETPEGLSTLSWLGVEWDECT